MSQVTYTAVVAMAADRAIGLNGTMPWHLKDDMKLFKRLTMGHPIVMGRKTWESLGRPLPGRQNIVLTRDTAYRAEGAEVIHAPEDLATMALQNPEVMIIGGAQIYALFLPLLDKLHVSEVQGTFAADTYFPDFAPHFTTRTPLEPYEGFTHVLYER